MDEGLIQVHAMATRAASGPMATWHLRVSRDSVQQASCPRGCSPWHGRAPAHAGIPTRRADLTDDPVLPRCHWR
jgi:hypothetical protein